MYGGLAQLGEHLLCKQGVVGSIPSSSTKWIVVVASFELLVVLLRCRCVECVSLKLAHFCVYSVESMVLIASQSV